MRRLNAIQNPCLPAAIVDPDAVQRQLGIKALINDMPDEIGSIARRLIPKLDWQRLRFARMSQDLSYSDRNLLKVSHFA